MAVPRAIDCLQDKGWILPILDWMSRSEDIVAAAKVPYRMLEAVPKLDGGNGAPANMLIQGDNLDALKALLPFYAGRVKCIYIDPPYNTRSAFEHYDDNLEHAQWLAMIYPRLVLLRELLAENGSIWVSIDDNEGHYLKVVLDEVFGRANFVNNIIWEKSDSPKMDSKLFSSRHDHIHCYGKKIDNLTIKRMAVDSVPAHFNRTDDAGRRYYTKPLRAMGSGDDTREARPTLHFPMVAPDGMEVLPMRPDGIEGRWRWSAERVARDQNLIEWVNGRNGWSPYYRIFADAGSGRPPETIWAHGEVGTNRTSKAEVNALFSGEQPFTTPKPEALMQRILQIATDPGDLVLDSFLGSGTTAAVAHKMGRQWIGIEMGDHAETHCKPRLDKVIEGEQGGISEAVEWKGGGGYRYYRLGPPAFDATGRIEPDIGFDALAAHIWFSETGQPAARGEAATSPVLGLHDGTAYALLYNGILGDRRPEGGNVLTPPLLAGLKAEHPDHTGPWVIYGEACKVPSARLKAGNVTFKQTPYDVKAR